MALRRVLPHLDTNFHTAQPLVEQPQSTLNALVTSIARESRVAVIQGKSSQLLSEEHWEISQLTSAHLLTWFLHSPFTCPTRCSIHHRHWADRCTAPTLRHFLQLN